LAKDFNKMLGGMGQVGSMAQFINSDNNTILNMNLRQVDEKCFYDANGKKCNNEFQEKCNFCQYMFCKVHLRVSERFFLCDNCDSIMKTKMEIDRKVNSCSVAACYCSMCFCIGPLTYCATVALCLPTWSSEAHAKYRIKNVPHLSCKGTKALCGLIDVPCPGHGPSAPKDEKMEDRSTDRTPLLSKDERVEARSPATPLSPSSPSSGGNVTVLKDSSKNDISNNGTGRNQTTLEGSDNNRVSN